MTRSSATHVVELGLQRADHPVHEWGDDPGSEIWRACLTHPVLCRMLESAEALAPFWKVSREVAFSLLRDLVIEESEHSPFGLVARDPESEPEREPPTGGSMGLGEILSEAVKLADARHGRPRVPEWAVVLDAEDWETGGRSSS